MPGVYDVGMEPGPDHHEDHDHQHHGHHHGDVHLDNSFWASAAAQTELEGEVLIDFVTLTAARLRELHPSKIRRIVDVGSGPGVATCVFAAQFPEATVLAVDGSSAMLERAIERATLLGVIDRVETLVAQVPDGLGLISAADVVWASMSLHHVADEIAALRALRGLLAPDGVIAIVEFGDPLRSLPDDLGFGETGLADRLLFAQSEWFASMRSGLEGAVESQDLAAMVTASGLTILTDDIVGVHIESPLPENARAWLTGNFRRTVEQFQDRLSQTDIAALNVLIDANDSRSIMTRADVFVDASRRIIIAK